MDKNDLAALLMDAPAEEVDRIHRLLHEWNVGPDNSFPVQLALLTKAQWRIAANLPRLMNDSRKLMELHLAEYQRQTRAMVDIFSSTAEQQTVGLKAALESHAKTTEQTVEQINVQLADAETVARRIKSLMESAVSEWTGIKANTKAQCQRLEQVAKDLDDRFVWQEILRKVFWFSLAITLGLLLGHFCWTINISRGRSSPDKTARESRFDYVSPVVASRSNSPPP